MLETLQRESINFILYKRRFAILICASFILFMNGEMWISLSSITPQLETYFNKTTGDINWFSNIFLVTLAIEAIPSVFFPEIFGLSWCLYISAAFNTIGAVLRVFIIYYPSLDSNARFIICLIGNLFPALAQGFILNLPSYISLRWFGEKERDTSTSIMYALNLFGVAIGFLFAYSIVVNLSGFVNDLYPLKIIFLSEFGVNIIILIGLVICMKERPPTPPSRSQENTIENSERYTKLQKMKKFVVEMFKLAKNYKAVLYLLTYGCYYAGSTVFTTFLVEMLYQYFTDLPNFTGFIGSVAIMAGASFAFIFGFLCSKYGPTCQRIIGAVCCLFSGIISVLIIVILNTPIKRIEIIFFLIVAYLIFAVPYNSIGIEQLANMTFPLEPQISTNAALIIANILGAVIIYGLGHLDPSEKYIYSISISAILYFFCASCVIFVKYEKYRSDFDNLIVKESTTTN